MSSTKSNWNINSDIYNILDSVNELQKRYIENEDDTTLSLGIFGFVADTEAKKIQTSAIMTGQLGNEMFPSRALLTKNVLTHAAFNGITDINATPSHMTITLCINVKDFNEHAVNGVFYLDAKSPIFIDEKLEFHLDYDVKITKKKINGKYNWSAQYVVMDENDNKIINRLSDITNPYLKQPFILNIGRQEYIGIQAVVRQYTIEEIKDRMVSDSIIENKSYTFEFENQMADFKVVVTDNEEETELTPYIYGMDVDANEKYCWYLYVSENVIRITFDSKSYIPGTSSSIYIKSYTTLGAEGNFNYLDVDETSEGLYVDLDSETYGYNTLTCYLVAVTDSEDGTDRKTKRELQKLIPKAALARGSITTETDLANYFNLIDNENNRLCMRKKVDNQLSRVWYGYFVLKDDMGDIIPTNSIDIRLVINNNTMVLSNDGRYILPAGSVIKYDPETQLGTVIDDSDVPVLFSEKYFDIHAYYYMTVYNVILCRDPLYAAFYLSISNYDSYFLYEFVNEEAETQFIANRFHFARKLLLEQDTYIMNFNIAQSIIDSDLELYTKEIVEYIDKNGNKMKETIITQNIRVILVVYNENGIAYRWKECDIVEVDESNKVYGFEISMTTDNMLDDNNRIKITDMNIAGTQTELYGYFSENCSAKIYILANLEISPEVEYPRKDLDNIAPGYENFVVTNVYGCVDGLQIYTNYTSVLDSRVKVDDTNDTTYYVSKVPCVGRHYMRSESQVKYLIEQIGERKAYIDYCLELVENNMNIDFKYFNTYGPAVTYKLEDQKTSIINTDLHMYFKLSLKNETDTSTKPAVIKSIKGYIEDLYETGDWHAPNLITDIINEYEDRINFIEFVGFNIYDADDQHIVLIDTGDPTTVPEFINIRNRIDPETGELEPCIDIEIV